jgi:hypothetical protein
MNKGKYVFAQLVELLPRYEFDKCVERHDGNFKVIDFTWWVECTNAYPGQNTYLSYL